MKKGRFNGKLFVISCWLFENDETTKLHYEHLIIPRQLNF